MRIKEFHFVNVENMGYITVTFLPKPYGMNLVV